MSALSQGVPSARPADFGDEIRGARRIVSVMGTVFTVDVRDLDLDSEAVDQVVDWWRWVDATFSTYRSDSAVMQLAEGRRRLDECPTEVRDVLTRCQRAAEVTDGYFTAYPHGRLDPTGMVKGWSVELASAMLREAGSRTHCIAAGGDLRTIGEPTPGAAWRLGVVDPSDHTRIAAVVIGKNLAVATSGTSERGPHIIDPVGGGPATELASVTLVGRDLAHVDAMATAAFAMGQRCRTWLAGQADLGAFVVGVDGAWWVKPPPDGARIDVL